MIKIARHKPIACKIIDIGSAGCRIRVADAARLKGPLTLEYQGQKLSAQVVWTQEGMAGLWFPSARAEEAEPGLLRRAWDQLRGRG